MLCITRISLFLLLSSTMCTAWAQGYSLEDRRADFSEFQKDFQQSYAYRDSAEQPWLTWQQRYAAAVDAAKTAPAFAQVFADALSELHDFHAEVRVPVETDWLPAPSYADVWAESTPAGARIVAVRQDGDAAAAGIRVGDMVEQVDGHTMQEAVHQRLGSFAADTTPKAQQWAVLSVLTGIYKQPRMWSIRTPGSPARTITLPAKRTFRRPAGLLESRELTGGLGYIRLHNSLGDQATVNAIDAALVQLRNTRGLILDLRDTPSGGDSSVALGIMGRFTQTTQPYQRHRIPHYGQADVERNWLELVSPRGAFAYTSPVVILVDHWTGSMGEGMAVGLDAMHAATVVGTPMAHLAGAVSDDRLSHTGVRVAYATEQLYTVSGVPRHEWLPPVLVTPPAGAADDDSVMQAGLRVLKAAILNTGVR